MLGTIIGDIIGSRFEFANHRSTDFDLFTKDCSFTDDTICTIAVADALLKKQSFEQSIRYWCGKYPHPTGGYGNSFAQWLKLPDPKPYYSFGNGSAMRVSPCAWISNDRNVVLNNARLSAECTHNHPEGIKGAVVTADCIYQILNGASKEYIHNLAGTIYNYDLGATCDEIRATNTFNETCQITVPQAIIAFIESTDFESAIRLAVSIGGDSDTIAAITGGLAQAFYGIPEHIEKMALSYLPADIVEVLTQFNDKFKNNGKA